MHACLGEIVGSFPDQHDKASPNLFVGGRSCLQFVKNAASVKHNKVKRNKARRAFRMRVLFVRAKWKCLREMKSQCLVAKGRPEMPREGA